jgi:hypothetical protein
MPAEQVVSRFLERVASHKARLVAVAAAVLAVLASRRLSSAAMGRALPSGRAKHSIKRFDRLLGNYRLHAELQLFYGGIAGVVVTTLRPVILIDWTQVRGPFVALSAALATEHGRPLTLWCRVHHVRMLGNARVQRDFLRQLATVLPPGTRPIVVTDAGFHGDFFRQVRAMGWDFLGRIRGTACLYVDGHATTKQALYERATARPRDYCNAGLYTAKTLAARLVLVRRPHSKRRSKPTQNKEHLEYRKQARDPWLLATSLDRTEADAERVIKLYGQRMQIEESFRDAKNPRFGIGLSDARCRTAKRLDVQLLLAALATATAYIIGLEIERRGEHLGFQANTRRTRVLSLVRLGIEWLAAHVGEMRAKLEELRGLFPLSLSQIRGDP